MVKLGNIKKVGEKYVERTTGRELTTRQVNQIIPIQRAQGKMGSERVVKAVNTVTKDIMKSERVTYSEARQRAKDRIENALVDREYHGDEEDYEEMEWSP